MLWHDLVRVEELDFPICFPPSVMIIVNGSMNGAFILVDLYISTVPAMNGIS